MNKKIIQIVTQTKMQGKEIKGCFYCPLKFHCGLCTYKTDKEIFNHGNCDCTDERYIFLEKVFNFNTSLLNNVIKENKKYVIKG